MGPGLRWDDTNLPAASPSRRRFTLEELVVGMTPERSDLMEDDWPVGDELI